VGLGAPRRLLILQVPGFGFLVLAALVSNVGSWVQAFTEQWAVVLLAGPEAARWSGRLSFALGLAVLLLTPFGGALVDRFDRRKLLALSQAWLALLAGAMGILALVPGGLTLHRLIAFAVATGVGIALAGPALHSLLPDPLSEDQLAAGAGSLSIQFNVSRMVGPALAALLLPILGLGGNFLLNALSFLGLILVASRLKLRKAPAPHGPEGSYAEALQVCRQDPQLRLAMFLSLVAGCFAWSYHAFVSVFAVRYLHAGAQGAASLLAFYGGGAILGSLVISRDRGGPLWPRLLWAIGTYACALMVLSLFPHPLLSPAIVAILGIAHAIFGNFLSVVVQRQAPQRIRGRINGLYLTAILGLMPLGNLLAGEIAQALGFHGVRWVLGAQGLLLLGAALLGALMKRRAS